jgi:hypothetical protein
MLVTGDSFGQGNIVFSQGDNINWRRGQNDCCSGFQVQRISPAPTWICSFKFHKHSSIERTRYCSRGGGEFRWVPLCFVYINFPINFTQHVPTDKLSSYRKSPHFRKPKHSLPHWQGLTTGLRPKPVFFQSTSSYPVACVYFATLLWYCVCVLSGFFQVSKLKFVCVYVISSLHAVRPSYLIILNFMAQIT